MPAPFSPSLRYKIGRAAALLAQSPLDDNIKQIISENFEKMSENDLDELMRSLEREEEELKHVHNELARLSKDQAKDWHALEEKQRQKAKQMAEEFLKRFV